MAAPILTSLSPAAGITGGGTVVNIVGTGLGAVTAVTFGATAAADFAILSATQVVAVAPAGSGIVSLTATNVDGASNGLSYQFTDGLFTVAEARAYGKTQLADAATYTNAAIIAKEAEIREFFTAVCGVDFIPTTHIDEYADGNGSANLILRWPKITSVLAASTRSGITWTALTAEELARVFVDATATRIINWETGYWPAGTRTIKVTYVAGIDNVPIAVREAALKIAVSELPTSNVPYSAESYDASGISVSYASGDGYNGAWHRIPEVRRLIRLYSHRVGIG